jgi:hypothetical protein
VDNELDARMASLWRSADQRGSDRIFEAALLLDDRYNIWVVRAFRLAFTTLVMLSVGASVYFTGALRIILAACSLLFVLLTVP